MEILFLGTGAATASPLPFCNCALCKTARARGGTDFRRRSSVLIDGKLLIDLGPDSVAAAHTFGADFSKVEILLQTHAHSDHFDAGHLITRISDYATENPSELALAASPECLSRMSDALAREESGATLFTREWRERLKMRVFPLRHGERTRIGEYGIAAVESAHDPAGGSLLYVVRSGDAAFLYACDTQLLTPAAWAFLESLDFPLTAAAIDCTYGPGIKGGGHMNADEVANAVVRLNCPRVYATHLSHEGMLPHAEMEEWARARGFRVAYDGLRLSL